MVSNNTYSFNYHTWGFMIQIDTSRYLEVGIGKQSSFFGFTTSWDILGRGFASQVTQVEVKYFSSYTFLENIPGVSKVNHTRIIYVEFLAIQGCFFLFWSKVMTRC